MRGPLVWFLRALSMRASSTSGTMLCRSSKFRGVHWGQGERDAEDAATARPVLHPNPSAVCLQDAPTDRQAQSTPSYGRSPAMRRTVEAVENCFALAHGHTRTTVGHIDQHLSACPPGPN